MLCWDHKLHLRKWLGIGWCCWSASSPCRLFTSISTGRYFSSETWWWALLSTFCKGVWFLDPGIRVPASSYNSEVEAQLWCGAEAEDDNSSVGDLLPCQEVRHRWTQCTGPSGVGEVGSYGEAVSTVGSKGWTDSRWQLLQGEVQRWQRQPLLSCARQWLTATICGLEGSNQAIEKKKSKSVVQPGDRYPERKR